MAKERRPAGFVLLSTFANAQKSSVEESLIEMYLAGISVRRVEDITEALWARG